MKKICILVLLTIVSFNYVSSQISISGDKKIDYANPKEYEIGGITVSGVEYLDKNVLIMLSGLSVGERIMVPGDKITNAIKKLWKQGLFENIKITATDIQGNLIFLNIHLSERPRLSKFKFRGVNRTHVDNIREKIQITRGDVVTDNLLLRTKYKIKKYFTGKGFLDAEVKVTQKPDTAAQNKVILVFDINKKKKIKVRNIVFEGNKNVHDGVLKRAMKETTEKVRFKPLYNIDKYLINTLNEVVFHNDSFDINQAFREYTKDRLRLAIFKSSKFIKNNFKDDKVKVIDKYNELGYRDGKITGDTIIRNNDNTLDIKIYVDEGDKYYFRNIYWVGNTKFTDKELNTILKIEKGDIYNQKILESNLYGTGSMQSLDVSSLYMDDGYLFFNATPVEVKVVEDSIDIEIRIYEGEQATIERITVKGNTRTNDHVIYREIRTKPGQLFSKTNIIRTQRELAQLRYFNQEKMAVNPIPDPQKGTVDIEYELEETSTDQIELSGGWGYNRFIGTLGFSFNNFSVRNLFNFKSYQPLPIGDGQRVSLRAQTNGKYYQSYSFSFTEPWLGGKKPNSLTLSYYRTILNYSYKMKINGASVGLGKRLKWPDDYFTLYQAINFRNYNFKDYPFYEDYSNGTSNNFSYNIILGRNSTDAPIFPQKGSDISLSLEATPPYSAFDDIENYDELSNSERFKWLEYHKWKFKYSMFVNLAGKLVLNPKAKFGFIGKYNKDLGDIPFERFYLGGDGFSNYGRFDGREIIALRGYDDNSLTPSNPPNTKNYIGGTTYNKYTLELKYPLSLNPTATIYVLSFAEGGNAWERFRDFNPYDIKRSAGLGLRLFLPMLGGLLGFDWAYGFDEIPGQPNANKGHFHFSINQSID